MMRGHGDDCIGVATHGLFVATATGSERARLSAAVPGRAKHHGQNWAVASTGLPHSRQMCITRSFGRPLRAASGNIGVIADGCKRFPVPRVTLTGGTGGATVPVLGVAMEPTVTAAPDVTVRVRDILLGSGPRFARDAFGPLLVFYVGWKVAGLAAGILAATALAVVAWRWEVRRERPGVMARVGLVLV